MAKKLTDVVKSDFGKIYPFGKGVLKGAIYGIGTGFALNSGLKHLKNNFDGDKNNPESFGEFISQFTAFFISTLCA